MQIINLNPKMIPEGVEWFTIMLTNLGEFAIEQSWKLVYSTNIHEEKILMLLPADHPVAWKMNTALMFMLHNDRWELIESFMNEFPNTPFIMKFPKDSPWESCVENMNLRLSKEYAEVNKFDEATQTFDQWRKVMLYSLENDAFEDNLIYATILESGWKACIQSAEKWIASMKEEGV